MSEDVEDIYPLSPLQQGMLFHTLLAPEAGKYVMQLACRLDGHVDVTRLEDSWAFVLDRHPALRTSFAWDQLDEPLQIVHRAMTVPIATVDWRGTGDAEQAERLVAFLREDRRRGFASDRPPLMRITLASAADDRYTLIWTCHHLLLDGWSLGLVLQEWMDRYRELGIRTPSAQPVPRPFRDYIAWLGRQPAGEAERYWRAQLDGLEGPTPLPFLRSTASSTDGELAPFGRQRALLESALSEGLRELARRESLTLNTLFQGAWGLLLSRYSGRDDVLFGTTVSGRPAELTGIQTMVGMFINTQPVRLRIDGAATLGTWLQRLQEQQAHARQYDHASLTQIHGWCSVPRDTALFDTLLVVESFPTADPGTAVLAIRDVEVHNHTNYTLDVDVIPGPQIELIATFDEARLDARVVARLLRHLHHLLEQMVARPGARLRELSVLSAQEREQLISGWNDRHATYPIERSVHELVDAQVERAPHRIAVQHGDAHLTYAELARKAGALAHALVAAGVRTDTIVGLLGERNVDFAVGILGILKAGGAYLPLDPDEPIERSTTILSESGASHIVVSARARAQLEAATEVLPAQARPRAIELDAVVAGAHDVPDLPVRARGTALAYIIFTSGSTGQPKGAMLEHRGKINNLYAMIEFLGMTSSDVMAQTAAQCFDISVWQFIAPWLVGGRVEIFQRDTQRDPSRFLRQLDQTGATIVEVVPSLLFVLVEELERMGDRRFALRALRWIISTGEILSPALCRRWLALYPGIPVVNAYGPTETSDDTNLFAVRTSPDPSVERIPVGIGLPNLPMYILDAALEPVPIGVPGELYIGGVGVGRGYRNDPARTASVYLPDPFAKQPGARFYKSGDLCRRDDTGQIEFVERADFQVKMRGYRIEPGEIEAALVRHGMVKQSAVIPWGTAEGKRLVGCLVLDVTASARPREVVLGELRAHLLALLPSYMVPDVLVILPTLPLTSNGKVDRKALLALVQDMHVGARTVVPPRTDLERQILAIWQEILARTTFGVLDEFFELGGHSLRAIRIHSRLREAFQVDVPLRRLFELTTVAAQAEYIETVRWGAAASPSWGGDREDIEL